MPNDKFAVTVARRADRMLLSHSRFLAQVSPAAAGRLLLGFRKMTRRLADNPYQFPFADELDAPGLPMETYRKCLIDKRYKCLFLVEGRNVYIDAVIDCRQENKDLY
jgi:plasmid stabilization system protein ParE